MVLGRQYFRESFQADNFYTQKFHQDIGFEVFQIPECYVDVDLVAGKWGVRRPRPFKMYWKARPISFSLE